MKRALLIGGRGRLGTAIVRGWNDWHVIAPSHAELPLENADALRAALESEGADAVVNCAAFADVDACEAAPERALAVNATAVEAAARVARDAGAAFAAISTDYVFDGRSQRAYTERDAARPLSAYGRSKREGERLLEAFQDGVLVVRTCGLYGHPRPHGAAGDFVQRVLDGARRGDRTAVVSDAIASPTYAGHLASALGSLLDAGCNGLYHAASAGPVSWYDFAAELLAQAGFAGAALQPIPRTQWKAAAQRPAFSALDSAKLAADTGFAMPSWREGIAAYLRDYPAFSLEPGSGQPVR